MPPPEPNQLVSLLRATLDEQCIQYELIIESFGQVQASERRLQGKQFTLQDHVRGLILSLLSNQRRWHQIADHLCKIDQIFFHYDAERIKETDPNQFEAALRNIHCGNRNTRRQMRDLRRNIKTFDRIIAEYGSLDNFVTSDHPWKIADQLSIAGVRYKLAQVGHALAMEYLKNVGIPAFKPDVHAKRVIGGKRLAYIAGEPSELETYDAMQQLARDAGVNIIYLDNLLWLFCAEGYGNICGAHPRCKICHLSDFCNYPVHQVG